MYCIVYGVLYCYYLMDFITSILKYINYCHSSSKKNLKLMLHVKGNG